MIDGAVSEYCTLATLHRGKQEEFTTNLSEVMASVVMHDGEHGRTTDSTEGEESPALKILHTDLGMLALIGASRRLHYLFLLVLVCATSSSFALRIAMPSTTTTSTLTLCGLVQPCSTMCLQSLSCKSSVLIKQLEALHSSKHVLQKRSQPRRSRNKQFKEKDEALCINCGVSQHKFPYRTDLSARHIAALQARQLKKSSNTFGMLPAYNKTLGYKRFHLGLSKQETFAQKGKLQHTEIMGWVNDVFGMGAMQPSKSSSVDNKGSSGGVESLGADKNFNFEDWLKNLQKSLGSSVKVVEPSSMPNQQLFPNSVATGKRTLLGPTFGLDAGIGALSELIKHLNATVSEKYHIKEATITPISTSKVSLVKVSKPSITKNPYYNLCTTFSSTSGSVIGLPIKYSFIRAVTLTRHSVTSDIVSPLSFGALYGKHHANNLDVAPRSWLPLISSMTVDMSHPGYTRSSDLAARMISTPDSNSFDAQPSVTRYPTVARKTKLLYVLGSTGVALSSTRSSTTSADIGVNIRSLKPLFERGVEVGETKANELKHTSEGVILETIKGGIDFATQLPKVVSSFNIGSSPLSTLNPFTNSKGLLGPGFEYHPHAQSPFGWPLNRPTRIDPISPLRKETISSTNVYANLVDSTRPLPACVWSFMVGPYLGSNTQPNIPLVSSCTRDQNGGIHCPNFVRITKAENTKTPNYNSYISERSQAKHICKKQEKIYPDDLVTRRPTSSYPNASTGSTMPNSQAMVFKAAPSEPASTMVSYVPPRNHSEKLMSSLLMPNLLQPSATMFIMVQNKEGTLMVSDKQPYSVTSSLTPPLNARSLQRTNAVADITFDSYRIENIKNQHFTEGSSPSARVWSKFLQTGTTGDGVMGYKPSATFSARGKTPLGLLPLVSAMPTAFRRCRLTHLVDDSTVTSSSMHPYKTVKKTPTSPKRTAETVNSPVFRLIFDLLMRNSTVKIHRTKRTLSTEPLVLLSSESAYNLNGVSGYKCQRCVSLNSQSPVSASIETTALPQSTSVTAISTRRPNSLLSKSTQWMSSRYGAGFIRSVVNRLVSSKTTYLPPTANIHSTESSLFDDKSNVPYTMGLSTSSVVDNLTNVFSSFHVKLKRKTATSSFTTPQMESRMGTADQTTVDINQTGTGLLHSSFTEVLTSSLHDTAFFQSVANTASLKVSQPVSFYLWHFTTNSNIVSSKRVRPSVVIQTVVPSSVWNKTLNTSTPRTQTVKELKQSSASITSVSSLSARTERLATRSSGSKSIVSMLPLTLKSSTRALFSPPFDQFPSSGGFTYNKLVLPFESVGPTASSMPQPIHSGSSVNTTNGTVTVPISLISFMVSPHALLHTSANEESNQRLQSSETQTYGSHSPILLFGSPFKISAFSEPSTTIGASEGMSSTGLSSFKVVHATTNSGRIQILGESQSSDAQYTVSTVSSGVLGKKGFTGLSKKVHTLSSILYSTTSKMSTPSPELTPRSPTGFTWKKSDGSTDGITIPSTADQYTNTLYSALTRNDSTTFQKGTPSKPIFVTSLTSASTSNLATGFQPEITGSVAETLHPNPAPIEVSTGFPWYGAKWNSSVLWTYGYSRIPFLQSPKSTAMGIQKQSVSSIHSTMHTLLTSQFLPSYSVVQSNGSSTQPPVSKRFYNTWENSKPFDQFELTKHTLSVPWVKVSKSNLPVLYSSQAVSPQLTQFPPSYSTSDASLTVQESDHSTSERPWIPEPDQLDTETHPLIYHDMPEVEDSLPSPFMEVNQSLSTPVPIPPTLSTSTAILLQCRLNGIQYTQDLQDHSSQTYRTLAREVQLTMDRIFSARYGSTFLGTRIMAFLNGSVIVQFEVLFQKEVSPPSSSNLVRTVVTEVYKNTHDYFFWKIDPPGVHAEGRSLRNLEPEKMSISFLTLGMGFAAPLRNPDSPLELLCNEVVQILAPIIALEKFLLTDIRNIRGDLSIKGDLYINTDTHTDARQILQALMALVNHSVDLSSLAVAGVRLDLQIYPVTFRITNRALSVPLMDHSTTEFQQFAKDLVATVLDILKSSLLLQVVLRDVLSGSVLCRSELLYQSPAPPSKEVLQNLLNSVSSSNVFGNSVFQVDPTSFVVADAKPDLNYVYPDFPGFAVAIIVLCGLVIISIPIIVLLFLKTNVFGRHRKAVIQKHRDPERGQQNLELTNQGYHSVTVQH
ncbi:mucin-3A-like [Ambystoma mexicanum]|uniref:mucin-3A-like n=1 Tax=Ambystoma mexicanum TaxID=8296 RepID=UPI0037E99528